MKFWKYVSDQLNTNHKVAFMCVIESIGSSPGRQGFKMAVSEDGTMSGSIGGGIMEHKLVELCRSMLNDPFEPFIKKQIHQDNIDTDRSGMICSGEQTIAFYYLTKKDLSWLEAIQKCLEINNKGILSLSDTIEFTSNVKEGKPFAFSNSSESTWSYQEQIGFKHQIFILGAGHVGLTLSEMMNRLGFYVIVMDDRDALNTMYQNTHAHHTEVIDYETIGHYILENDTTYVVLVSFGYRTDKVLLKQLLGKKYKYLGMMGSVEKVKRLYKELLNEGFNQEQLNQVHSPIGIPISSKTPEEIAVSIAAEIIKVKNG